MAKRNKTTNTAKTTKAPAKARAKVVNADEMAKAVSTTFGNDYQQYIRGLFKDRLKK